MKNTQHNGPGCQISFCAFPQTKIIAPYTEIKGNAGVKKAAQPMAEIQQFHRAFLLAFSLPGHFLDLYAHFLPSAFASVTEGKKSTNKTRWPG